MGRAGARRTTACAVLLAADGADDTSANLARRRARSRSPRRTSPRCDSVQLKGRAAPVEPATVEPTAIRLERYCAGFFGDDRRDRRHAERAAGAPRCRRVRCVALAVTVDELFDQTPGPAAGRSRSQPDLTMTDARPVSLREISCCFEGVVPAVIATGVGRRHAERHPPLARAHRRRRARRAVEPVLLEDDAQPGREPARVRAADRSGHLRRVPADARVRAHRAARPGVRAAAPRRRRHRRAHRHAGRLQAAERRHLPRRRAGAGHVADGRRRRDRRARAGRAPAAGASSASASAACPDLDSLVSRGAERPRRAASATSTRCCCCSTRTAAGSTRSRATATTTEGIGSEVRVGEGIIGMAAARAEPMRVGNLGQMLAYARTVAARVRGERRRRRRARRSRSRVSPTPRARWRCRRWCSASSSACSSIESRAQAGVHAGRRGAADRRRDDGRERDRDRLGPGARAEARRRSARVACRARAAVGRRRPACGSSRSTAARSSTATT